MNNVTKLRAGKYRLLSPFMMTHICNNTPGEEWQPHALSEAEYAEMQEEARRLEILRTPAPFGAILAMARCAIPLGVRRETSVLLKAWVDTVETVGYPVYAIEEALYATTGPEQGLPDMQEFLDSAAITMANLTEVFRRMIELVEATNGGKDDASETGSSSPLG